MSPISQLPSTVPIPPGGWIGINEATRAIIVTIIAFFISTSVSVVIINIQGKSEKNQTKNETRSMCNFEDVFKTAQCSRVSNITFLDL